LVDFVIFNYSSWGRFKILAHTASRQKWLFIDDNTRIIYKIFINSRTVMAWIYNYLCNQCLSRLMLWVRISIRARCTRYNIMWSSLSVTCGRSVVFSGFLHQ
jgi:hypothetical protein